MKKRYTKRRRTGGSAKRVAYKALRIAKRMTPETKYVDITIASTPNWNGSTFDLLSTITQGIGDFTTRVGDKISLKSLTARLTVDGDFNNVPSQIIRIIILKYKQPTALTLNPSNVLTPALLGTINAVNAPKTYDQRFLTKILFDKTYTVREQTVCELNSKFRFSLKGIYPQWQNAGSGSANQLTDGLWCLVVSDQNPANPLPDVNIVYRLTYTDA